MAVPRHYASIVIGSGQAGTPLASALAKAGRSTALIERSHLGGCCVNEGCTPTKTMIASGRAAYLARRGGDYGVGVGNVVVDMQKIRQRRRDIVASFRSGSERRIAEAGVDVLWGEARFEGEKKLRVLLNEGGRLA
jgi:pyruvate/2-oxoglutarate dehydrogenase complex dihydrolipoamide dehydrogenase (E3) component